MIFSEEYFKTIELYKKLHSSGTTKLPPQKTFAGYSLIKWIPEIQSIIKINKANSIIDFGCGKALAYKGKIQSGQKTYSGLKEFWAVENITLYDPGVKEFNNYPKKKSDGVICTDVLEHIPTKDIFHFIDGLYSLSKKFIFLVVATIPASKLFEDGRNIHLTLKNADEWNIIFNEFKNKYPKIQTVLRFNE